MKYRVEFTPMAGRQFNGLDRSIQIRLKRRIDVLASNPRPSGAEKMAGMDNLYRIRAGDYRIIYQIQDKVLMVLVVKIGHRREVYR